MPPPASRDAYFPRPRPELLNRLIAGDQALREAMQKNLQRLTKHAALVKSDEDHRSVYRLLSGTAAYVRTLEDGRRQVVAIFLPGDLLAVEAMLLDRQPDTIECLVPCAVQALGYSDAIELSVKNADVAFRFMWQLAEDERRLHNQVAMLGCGNAIERLSTMLIDFTGRSAVLGDAERIFAIRQQDIADYLGLTMVHVSRTLRSLREQGAITVKSGSISITDRKAVCRYAAPMLDIFEREAPEFAE